MMTNNYWILSLPLIAMMMMTTTDGIKCKTVDGEMECDSFLYKYCFATFDRSMLGCGSNRDDPAILGADNCHLTVGYSVPQCLCNETDNCNENLNCICTNFARCKCTGEEKGCNKDGIQACETEAYEACAAYQNGQKRCANRFASGDPTMCEKLSTNTEVLQYCSCKGYLCNEKLDCTPACGPAPGAVPTNGSGSMALAISTGWSLIFSSILG